MHKKRERTSHSLRLRSAKNVMYVFFSFSTGFKSTQENCRFALSQLIAMLDNANVHSNYTIFRLLLHLPHQISLLFTKMHRQQNFFLSKLQFQLLFASLVVRVCSWIYRLLTPLTRIISLREEAILQSKAYDRVLLAYIPLNVSVEQSFGNIQE